MQPYNRTDSTALPPGDAYTMLSNDRRRQIIEYLAQIDSRNITVRDIASYLSDKGDDRSAAYISCIQVQCPKMHEFGLIEYDERSKVVRVNSELLALYEAQQSFEAALRTSDP